MRYFYFLLALVSAILMASMTVGCYSYLLADLTQHYARPEAEHVAWELRYLVGMSLGSAACLALAMREWPSSKVSVQMSTEMALEMLDTANIQVEELERHHEHRIVAMCITGDKRLAEPHPDYYKRREWRDSLRLAVNKRFSSGL